MDSGPSHSRCLLREAKAAKLVVCRNSTLAHSQQTRSRLAAFGAIRGLVHLAASSQLHKQPTRALCRGPSYHPAQLSSLHVVCFVPELTAAVQHSRCRAVAVAALVGSRRRRTEGTTDERTGTGTETETGTEGTAATEATAMTDSATDETIATQIAPTAAGPHGRAHQPAARPAPPRRAETDGTETGR